MPISGVHRSPEALSYQPRTGVLPEVAHAVATTLSLFDTLQILDSEADATEALTDQYTNLVDLGLKGRLYPELTAEQAPFESLVTAIENKLPNGVSPIYCYHGLWTPGTEPESYTTADLDGATVDDSVRIALFNTQRTGVDPILHHLGLPYDQYAKEEWNPSASTTQLDAVANDKELFEAEHPGYSLNQLGARATLTLVLMDRIAGVDPRSSKYILNSGYLRTELGRRNVGGNSIVGAVDSDDGQLNLRGSVGIALSRIGVGVSAGPKS